MYYGNIWVDQLCNLAFFLLRLVVLILWICNHTYRLFPLSPLSVVVYVSGSFPVAWQILHLQLVTIILLLSLFLCSTQEWHCSLNHLLDIGMRRMLIRKLVSLTITFKSPLKEFLKMWTWSNWHYGCFSMEEVLTSSDVHLISQMHFPAVLPALLDMQEENFNLSLSFTNRMWM